MKPKEIFLSVFLILSALAGWWAIPQILGKPYLASAVLLYAVVLGFFLLLVKNKWIFWCVSTASFALGIFFFAQDQFLFYGAVAGAAMVFYAVRIKEQEEKASLKILLKRLVGQSLKVFFTALAVFLTFIYYGSVSRNPDPAKLLLPESMFSVTLKLLEAQLQSTIPGFRADATTGELFGPLEREAFARQYGIKLTGKEKISAVLYDIFLSRIKSFVGNYVEYIPFIAALSYFLILKTISAAFYYAALMLIFVILKVLLVAGLVKKITIPAEKEIYV
ncbi:hypothetical protein A2662_03675 [Candidatus Giovannonibacteria bacterium RIFCSPHIGHO2_01_FULL_45_33]|uniref:Uncharacterized protein n=1 Tax=Candidatus Giovannonibacteria bacterium RIFCSPLOWO2_01_FULL_45_34 TaxID=1798351 RepID=A0A1F5WYL2_9BACT|nr:MAG: hypothetical protein A2662_03675 [Candidatus Giovannonibacteria bacterium RIFCSPHIGHO2_01_FULL_45_33]OGF69745.1 MAG: hypothetical protein A3C73_01430 [Candidatus Giovannonibacteria bacterium RIFCSPHIGHO2_02_FULL_44_11]OGF80742.1 MAG: hypothetical protein A2930_03710 [Candidatus Giovannonibacteria bacterium RIFCSPLOWO2_01_FULL_45_34]